MLTINESIQKSYYDEGDGFGSMAKTLKVAKKYNNEVTLDDVRNWFGKHIGTNKQLKGYNSFVAQGAYQHHQIHIFFFEDLTKETGKKQP